MRTERVACVNEKMFTKLHANIGAPSTLKEGGKGPIGHPLAASILNRVEPDAVFRQIF
jgi:hypothetical protein